MGNWWSSLTADNKLKYRKYGLIAGFLSCFSLSTTPLAKMKKNR